MSLDLGIAEANLIDAACAFVDCENDGLVVHARYADLEAAREEYRRALVALPEGELEREEMGRGR